MAELNFSNRTLFHGDCLDVLRGMNSGTVHLIATDPPFKKNRDFHATPDSLAKGASFADRWNWDRDVHDEWVDAIADNWPKVEAVINLARTAYGDDMGAFLCWLGVRLMEMRRILREDGTIYVHIDHTAHAYVKALMDAIFGKKNFRNEIIWTYSGGGVPKRDFPRKHDTLLRYTKSSDYTFHVERKAYKENTQEVGIHSTYSGADNKIDLERGTPITDWWTDIPTVTGWAPENTGYPTQKPLELYKRIIRASSNEGDIVLDPFCGCATTPVAAEELARQWIGIDIWDKAHETVLMRLHDAGLIANGATPSNGSNYHLVAEDVLYTKDIPERTDDEAIPVPDLKLKIPRPKEPWQRLTHAVMRRILGRAQAVGDRVGCAGCGRTLEIEFMHLDHREPKSDMGGNHITNRVLLCQPCNGHKSDRLTVAGLRRQNKKTGWMQDETLAKQMLGRALAKGEWVRDSWDTDECKALIAEVRS